MSIIEKIALRTIKASEQTYKVQCDFRLYVLTSPRVLSSPKDYCRDYAVDRSLRQVLDPKGLNSHFEISQVMAGFVDTPQRSEDPGNLIWLNGSFEMLFSPKDFLKFFNQKRMDKSPRDLNSFLVKAFREMTHLPLVEDLQKPLYIRYRNCVNTKNQMIPFEDSVPVIDNLGLDRILAEAWIDTSGLGLENLKRTIESKYNESFNSLLIWVRSLVYKLNAELDDLSDSGARIVRKNMKNNLIFSMKYNLSSSELNMVMNYLEQLDA